MRLVRLALASALFTALTPLALSAQGASFPRCKDGTIATRTGYTACWFHGGVADGKTVAARPAPGAKRLPPSASPRARAATSKPKPAARSASASKSKSKVAKAKKTKKQKAKRDDSRTVFGTPMAATSKPGAAKPRKSGKPAAKTPKGATARCMDGTYTTAKRKKKACSKHGGVAGWLKPDIPPE